MVPTLNQVKATNRIGFDVIYLMADESDFRRGHLASQSLWIKFADKEALRDQPKSSRGQSTLGKSRIDIQEGLHDWTFGERSFTMEKPL